MSRAAGLGGRLGPALLRLPPTLPADPALLDAWLRHFPATVRVAVEPRHPSWDDGAVRAVLEKRGVALCRADSGSRPVTPLWRTAGWGCLRPHAGRARPWPRYGRQALRGWVHRLGDTWTNRCDLYVYLNNDPGGAAVRDAVGFAHEAVSAGRSVSRVPGRPR